MDALNAVETPFPHDLHSCFDGAATCERQHDGRCGIQIGYTTTSCKQKSRQNQEPCVDFASNLLQSKPYVPLCSSHRSEYWPRLCMPRKIRVYGLQCLGRVTAQCSGIHTERYAQQGAICEFCQLVQSCCVLSRRTCECVRLRQTNQRWQCK